MFYCTLYSRPKKSDELGDVVVCFSYESEAEAKAMVDYHVNRATEFGATVKESDGYYLIDGYVFASRLTGLEKATKAHGIHYYMIGVETEETLGANYYGGGKFPKYMILDGHKYNPETYKANIQRSKERAEAEAQEEQAFIDNYITKFETEIANITDIKVILNLMLKYAKALNKLGRDKLIDTVANKIQGEQPQEKADWYDELSNINN